MFFLSNGMYRYTTVYTTSYNETVDAATYVGIALRALAISACIRPYLSRETLAGTSTKRSTKPEEWVRSYEKLDRRTLTRGSLRKIRLSSLSAQSVPRMRSKYSC